MGGCASKPKESDIGEGSVPTENAVVESKNATTETDATLTQVCGFHFIISFGFVIVFSNINRHLFFFFFLSIYQSSSFLISDRRILVLNRFREYSQVYL